jgi:hypothetical protein
MASTGSKASSAPPTSTQTARDTPIAWLRPTSAGATVSPPTLAPFSASLIANPRRRSNRCARITAMAVVEVQAQPTPVTSALA